MIELVTVLGLLGALVGTMALLSYTPWDWLLGGGLGLAFLGLLLGVPTGFWYHVRLARVLRKKGPLPRGWWLRPDRLHAQLADGERARVMRPFYAGAIGFVMSVFGCLLIAYGAWRAPPG
jgi:hypothetical protein